MVANEVCGRHSGRVTASAQRPTRQAAAQGLCPRRSRQPQRPRIACAGPSPSHAGQRPHGCLRLFLSPWAAALAPLCHSQRPAHPRAAALPRRSKADPASTSGAISPGNSISLEATPTSDPRRRPSSWSRRRGTGRAWNPHDTGPNQSRGSPKSSLFRGPWRQIAWRAPFPHCPGWLYLGPVPPGPRPAESPVKWLYFRHLLASPRSASVHTPSKRRCAPGATSGAP